MSKVAVVLGIFTFYCFIIVIFGLMGRSDIISSRVCNGVTIGNSTGSQCDIPQNFSILTGFSFFLQGIGFTISSIPFWANFILFFPLGITIAWSVLP